MAPVLAFVKVALIVATFAGGVFGVMELNAAAGHLIPLPKISLGEFEIGAGNAPLGIVILIFSALFLMIILNWRIHDQKRGVMFGRADNKTKKIETGRVQD